MDSLRSTAVALVCAGMVAGVPASGGAATIGSLRFIGVATIPNEQQFDGTLVGGLSGLDYDPASDSFAVISDDKSDKAPARFYTVKLRFSFDRLFGAEVTGRTTFLQGNGQPYPNAKAGGEVPDPEAIRIDPETGNIWWTSEGDRGRGLNPFLRVVDRSGSANGRPAGPGDILGPCGQGERRPPQSQLRGPHLRARRQVGLAWHGGGDL